MSMIMFYVTFPNEQSALTISEKLVSGKLVACTNVMPVKSTYTWNAAIENDDEWVATMKTSHQHTGTVEQMIADAHPYETPCILHWEFECNLSYEKWLRQSLK